jgi:phosphoribosylamine--glycine ligase
MRILIVDPLGAQLDWAMRCDAAGHEVKLFISDTPKTCMIGKDLVEVVRDWHKWMNWADLVVLADNIKYLREMDAWRKTGKKIIGPTMASAEWELDRIAGQRIFQRAGIPVPTFKEFSDYDKAIAYVKKEDRAFVSKPCGDEPDKSLSYVAKSPADLVYMLERWKKAQKLKGSFMLQEKVKGVEMAVGAWFGPGGFGKHWLENWEQKKLAVGDLGVSTGEMGTIMRYTTTSKLAKKVLAPLEAALAKTGHSGYIDVNCIIDEEGVPWPLEFTARFGYPCWNIQQALHEGDPAEWLMDLANGKDTLKLKPGIAVGVVMSIPDFPYSHITRKDVCGIPLYGLSPSLIPNVHPCEMMQAVAPHQVEDKVVNLPGLATAGDYVLVTSGVGTTVRDARQAAYRVMHRLEMPNSPMYRTDIGLRLKSELPKLHSIGYAMQMDY